MASNQADGQPGKHEDRRNASINLTVGKIATRRHGMENGRVTDRDHTEFLSPDMSRPNPSAHGTRLPSPLLFSNLPNAAAFSPRTQLALFQPSPRRDGGGFSCFSPSSARGVETWLLSPRDLGSPPANRQDMFATPLHVKQMRTEPWKQEGADSQSASMDFKSSENIDPHHADNFHARRTSQQQQFETNSISDFLASPFKVQVPTSGWGGQAGDVAVWLRSRKRCLADGFESMLGEDASTSPYLSSGAAQAALNASGPSVKPLMLGQIPPVGHFGPAVDTSLLPTMPLAVKDEKLPCITTGTHPHAHTTASPASLRIRPLFPMHATSQTWQDGTAAAAGSSAHKGNDTLGLSPLDLPFQALQLLQKPLDRLGPDPQLHSQMAQAGDHRMVSETSRSTAEPRNSIDGGQGTSKDEPGQRGDVKPKQEQASDSDDSKRVKAEPIVALASPGGEKNEVRQCNCKKSKCLKLYCDCFSAMVYCTNCSCLSCMNTPRNATQVQEKRSLIKSRDPSAFQMKIGTTQQHKKGCNCKKSNCLKKYCECYQGGVACSAHCKCVDCHNYVAAPPPSSVTKRSKRGSRAVQELQDVQEAVSMGRQISSGAKGLPTSPPETSLLQLGQRALRAGMESPEPKYSLGLGLGRGLAGDDVGEKAKKVKLEQHSSGSFAVDLSCMPSVQHTRSQGLAQLQDTKAPVPVLPGMSHSYWGAGGQLGSPQQQQQQEKAQMQQQLQLQEEQQRHGQKQQQQDAQQQQQQQGQGQQKDAQQQQQQQQGQGEQQDAQQQQQQQQQRAAEEMLRAGSLHTLTPRTLADLSSPDFFSMVGDMDLALPHSTSLSQLHGLLSPAHPSAMQHAQNFLSPQRPFSTMPQSQGFMSPQHTFSLQQAHAFMSPPGYATMQQLQTLLSPSNDSSNELQTRQMQARDSWFPGIQPLGQSQPPKHQQGRGQIAAAALQQRRPSSPVRRLSPLLHSGGMGSPAMKQDDYHVALEQQQQQQQQQQEQHLAKQQLQQQRQAWQQQEQQRGQEEQQAHQLLQQQREHWQQQQALQEQQQEEQQQHWQQRQALHKQKQQEEEQQERWQQRQALQEQQQQEEQQQRWQQQQALQEQQQQEEEQQQRWQQRQALQEQQQRQEEQQQQRWQQRQALQEQQQQQEEQQQQRWQQRQARQEQEQQQEEQQQQRWQQRQALRKQQQQEEQQQHWQQRQALQEQQQQEEQQQQHWQQQQALQEQQQERWQQQRQQEQEQEDWQQQQQQHALRQQQQQAARHRYSHAEHFAHDAMQEEQQSALPSPGLAGTSTGRSGVHSLLTPIRTVSAQQRRVTPAKRKAGEEPEAETVGSHPESSSQGAGQTAAVVATLALDIKASTKSGCMSAPLLEAFGSVISCQPSPDSRGAVQQQQRWQADEVHAAAATAPGKLPGSCSTAQADPKQLALAYMLNRQAPSLHPPRAEAQPVSRTSNLNPNSKGQQSPYACLLPAPAATSSVGSFSLSSIKAPRPSPPSTDRTAAAAAAPGTTAAADADASLGGQGSSSPIKPDIWTATAADALRTPPFTPGFFNCVFAPSPTAAGQDSTFHPHGTIMPSVPLP